MQQRIVFSILTMTSLLIAQTAFSQSCADALTNYMCAGQTQTNEVLYAQYPAFFSLGTFTNVSGDSLNYAQWYSFHTNSSAPPGSVTVSVQVINCNYTGDGQNDLLYMSVYSIAPGGNPCAIATNTSALNATLSSGNSSFEYSLPTVLPNRDYIIVVGMFLPPTSNPAELPCGFSLTVSGSALGLVASANPPIIYGNQGVILSVSGQTNNPIIEWSPSQFVETPTQATTLAYPPETMMFQVTGSVGECPLVAEVIVTVTDPISVEEQENTRINLFPIPARDLINVQLTTPAPWAITDITGRTIMAKQSASSVFTINIESLPIGVYFLHSNESRIRFVKE